MCAGKLISLIENESVCLEYITSVLHISTARFSATTTFAVEASLLYYTSPGLTISTYQSISVYAQMSSSNFKNKQYPSLVRKRTSSAYGTKPVDNIYKKAEKSSSTATSRNFDPNIVSSTPKPQTKPRQTSLNNLFYGTTGHKATTPGNPTRKRLESLTSKTIKVIELDKAEDDNGLRDRHETNPNGSSHKLSSSDKDSETRYLKHQLLPYQGSNDSSRYAIEENSHTTREDDIFNCPDWHYDRRLNRNSIETNYQEKLETSSRIRERLNNLTHRTDRLLELKTTYAFREKEPKRTLISPDSKSSDTSLVNSHDSPPPSAKKPQSHPHSESSSPTLIPDTLLSVSPSPAPSISLEPEFTEVEDCDGNKLNVKECGLRMFPKVRHVLKSFHYHGQKVKKRNHRRIYEIAVSLNEMYIYIGWRHPSLGLVPVNRFVINIDSQLRNFSFANESFIIQLTQGQRFIIASHYGRDDDIRKYFTKHPNLKVKVGVTLTEIAEKRIMERATHRLNRATADPLARAVFQQPRRSSPRISKLTYDYDGVEYVGSYSSDNEGIDLFDDSDYNKFELIPDFKPELRYKFIDGTEITVNESDFKTLHRNYWVNDIIIDFGIKYIIEEGVKKGLIDASEIHSFNSFFFKKLTSGTKSGSTPQYYNNIKRWLSKLDLMKFKYLIIPVNTDLHWYCCIIRNLPGLLKLAQERKAAEDEPTDIDGMELQTKQSNQYAEIFVLDSLGNKRYNVSAPLKSFIIDYCKEKYDVEINRDQIRFQSTRIPRQNNFNDCGVHVLYNIRKWLNNITECEIFFKKHLQSQAKTIFPAEERRKERKYWSNILLELHKAQNPSHKDKPEPVGDDDSNDDDDIIEIMKESTVGETTRQHKGSVSRFRSNLDGHDPGSCKWRIPYHSTTRESLGDLGDLEIEDLTNDEVIKVDKPKINHSVGLNKEREEVKRMDQKKNDNNQHDDGPKSPIELEEQPELLPRQHQIEVGDTPSSKADQLLNITGEKQDLGDEAAITIEGIPADRTSSGGALTLKNLTLREQFKDARLYPSLCQLLNDHFHDENTPIKGVRWIVVKRLVQKAIDNRANWRELESLLKLYADYPPKTVKSYSGDDTNGVDEISASSRKEFSEASLNSNRDVTNMIENLRLANNHFGNAVKGDIPEKAPFVSPQGFNDQEWKQNNNQAQSLHSWKEYGGTIPENSHGSKENTFSRNISIADASQHDTASFRHEGFRSRGFRNDGSGKSGFGSKGFKGSESANSHDKKKVARDVVETDGFDIVAQSNRGSLPSGDSDVILDYPRIPYKKRKLD